jgi:hypothetical protein
MYRWFRIGCILIASAWISFLLFEYSAHGGRAFADTKQSREALEWMLSPPAANSRNGWTRLDKSRWRAVVEGKELRAESTLNGRSWVALSPDQASEMTLNSAPPSQAGLKPFLMRGIGAPDRTGGQDIQTHSDGDVLVGGGVLARHPVAIHRQCVVVWLDHEPHQVYVSFYVAE